AWQSGDGSRCGAPPADERGRALGAGASVRAGARVRVRPDAAALGDARTAHVEVRGWSEWRGDLLPAERTIGGGGARGGGERSRRHHRASRWNEHRGAQSRRVELAIDE